MRTGQTFVAALVSLAFVAIVYVTLLLADDATVQNRPEAVPEQAMLERNKSVVRDFQDKMDKGDVDGAVANFAENAEGIKGDGSHCLEF